MAPVPAPCPFCTHASTAFICSQCLTRLLAVYHTQTQAQHQATVSAAEKAKRALVVLNDNRQLKAKAWAKKENIRRAETELARLEGTAVQGDSLEQRSPITQAEQYECTVRRDIQQRKDALEGRRQRLRHIRAAMIADTASTASSAASTKKSSPGSLSNLQNGQAVLLSAIESIGPELAETRRVLLAETMEALDVRVRRHGPKLQHEVAGLLVPPVHDLLRKVEISPPEGCHRMLILPESPILQYCRNRKSTPFSFFSFMSCASSARISALNCLSSFLAI